MIFIHTDKELDHVLLNEIWAIHHIRNIQYCFCDESSHS